MGSAAGPGGVTRRFSAAGPIVALLLVAALAAGCATVPSGGVPRPFPPGGGPAEAYVQPLPPPGPSADWTPKQVVLGFLHASASYASEPRAARRYLSPSLSRTWKPGPVTVVSSLSKPKTLPYHPEVAQQQETGQDVSVEFTGQRLATLSQSGQYQYSPGTSTYQFVLTKVKSVWLISVLPLGGQSLLLTQSDFEEVFQPRNLFFYGPAESWAVNGNLVPDPVYAPLQSSSTALNTDLAAGLVQALITDRGSWLSGATTTAFPAGTRLLGVAIRGQTAIVDLGGTAARASSSQKSAMKAQILATLGSQAYSPALALNVNLKFNGRDQYPGVNQNLVYEIGSGELLAMTGLGTVGPVGTQANTLPDGLGTASITAVAAAPSAVAADLRPGTGGQSAGPVVAVAARSRAGCILYVPSRHGGQYRDYPLSASSGPCTSLSWDRNGLLWAVAGRHVWAVHTLNGTVTAVGGLSGILPGGQTSQLLELQMAPDAVRAALLIKTPSGNRMALSAVTSAHGTISLGPPLVVGTGVAGPAALSWYSPFDLLVLTPAGIRVVPLTGAAGKQLGPVPPDAVTLATDGREVAVGTSQGQIFSTTNGGNTWTRRGAGAFPAYSPS